MVVQTVSINLIFYLYILKKIQVINVFQTHSSHLIRQFFYHSSLYPMCSVIVSLLMLHFFVWIYLCSRVYTFLRLVGYQMRYSDRLRRWRTITMQRQQRLWRRLSGGGRWLYDCWTRDIWGVRPLMLISAT